AERVPGLFHRAAVPGLAVVADLDRLAALGQRIMRGLVGGPCGLGGAGLAVGLGIESVHAGGLAGDLVGLAIGGGPVGVVDVDVDGESGGAQRGGGGVDLGALGAAVPRVRDVPGPEAPGPAPALGLQDLGGAVTTARAVD